ncbi:MAG: YcgN family cysteine cluster protein [Gammaproteobacteria bacterium]
MDRCRQADSRTAPPFWERKTLAEMDAQEWESLCDGCGKCCLVKLEDERSGQVAYTDAACHLLDIDACRCRDYAQRTRRVPDCVNLTPAGASECKWLPSTCAYRLVAEGKPLAWWHPLLSGDPATVHQAGVSVRGRALSERAVVDLQARIVRWPEQGT